MTPVLRARDLAHRFGATRALEGVSLDLAAGRVRALLGTNGAGKSTLLNVLGGLLRPDAGSLELDGRPYAPGSPAEALRQGVQIITQEPAVVAELSVADNVMLGRERTRFGCVRRGRHRSESQAALARLGCGGLDVDLPARDLSLPLRHVVAMARALVAEARVVVFDEPTSALSGTESEPVLAVVRELAGLGTAVLYVTHFLDEAARVSDDWTVLRDGRVVAEGSTPGADVATWIGHLSGRPAHVARSRAPHEPGEVVLVVAGLSGSASPREVDLVLRRGEVFGLYGIAGAGRSSLLAAILGARARTRGAVRVGTFPPLAQGARAGVRAGLALLPEERRLHATLPGCSVLDNVALAGLERVARAGFVRPRARLEGVARALARVHASEVDPRRGIDELSGGMQQRVALARLVHAAPDVFLLDEPTRGIDVATKGLIRETVVELADAGGAVLLTSSSTEELLQTCDTIGVMCQGRLVDVRATSRWTSADLLACASRAGAGA